MRFLWAGGSLLDSHATRHGVLWSKSIFNHELGLCECTKLILGTKSKCNTNTSHILCLWHTNTTSILGKLQLVQHNHKSQISHFVLVTHKHKINFGILCFSFGNAPLLSPHSLLSESLGSLFFQDTKELVQMTSADDQTDFLFLLPWKKLPVCRALS